MKNRKKNVWIKLILISAIVGIAVSYISSKIPTKKTSFNTIYIDQRTDINRKYYNYDGFYSQQIAEKFTDTVKSLLQSDNLISKTLEEQGLANTKTERKKLLKELKVIKTGPQTLYITLTGPNHILLDNILMTLTKYISTFNENGNRNITIEIISKPSPVEDSSNYAILNGIVSGLITLLTGATILERKYLIKKIREI